VWSGTGCVVGTLWSKIRYRLENRNLYSPAGFQHFLIFLLYIAPVILLLVVYVLRKVKLSAQ